MRRFQSRRIEKLLLKFQNSHRRSLLEPILAEANKLISAAIHKMQIRRDTEDLRQDCYLKLLKAIPRYSQKRGTAFSFFWTIICNVCRTHKKHDWVRTQRYAGLSPRLIAKKVSSGKDLLVPRGAELIQLRRQTGHIPSSVRSVVRFLHGLEK